MSDMTQTWFIRIAAATLREFRSGSLLRPLAKRIGGIASILQRPLALCFTLADCTLHRRGDPQGADLSVFGRLAGAVGTIVRIDPCSSGFCMRIMFLSPTADATTDIHNPDATLRARSLCALELGSRFHSSDATHASGGAIYDPKSGNTYRGQMVVDGDLLRLRGYVGFSLFGRTEIWHRVHQSVASCH